MRGEIVKEIYNLYSLFLYKFGFSIFLPEYFPYVALPLLRHTLLLEQVALAEACLVCIQLQLKCMSSVHNSLFLIASLVSSCGRWKLIVTGLISGRSPEINTEP